MKKNLLLILAMTSIASYGQGLRLGNYYHKQQKQKTELQKKIAATICNKAEEGDATNRRLQKGIYIDQATKALGDNIYRYVFAYNKNMERSSETIYKKHFNGVEWSAEKLYNKGIYTYEYDSQGRIVSKKVIYEKPYTEFDSYVVSVDYFNDDYTLYTYSIITDNEEYRDSEWSFWKNGKLRHYTVFDGHSSNLREERSVSFDQNGSCTRMAADYKSKQFSGTLNDSTIIHNDTYYGYDNPKTLEHYVYNPKNGKLTEYKIWGVNDESRKYEYIYDAQGRISAIKKYYDADDDDADHSKAPTKAINREFSTNELEWKLEYNETYTYFNDEVYGIGNPWHDIFGMDGPIANRHLIDDDYEPDMPWVEDLTFNRDANGKLLSVVSQKTEEEGFIEENTFNVDANGHITRQFIHSKESWEGSDYNEETITTDYNWQGELLTSSHEAYSYKSSYSGNNTYTRDCSYTYGDGIFGYKRLSSGNDGNASSERSGSITKLNKGFKIVETDKYGQDIFIQEVQTEDISFIRPNLICDYDGFSTDSTIVVSIKDREVVYSNQQGSTYGDGLGWTDFEYTLGDASAYANTNDETYFSVSHEGDKTICSNAKGMLVFELQGNRLLKERIYEELYNNSVAQIPSCVSIPDAGYIIKEITYSYDENGLVNGQTVTTIDENGTTIDETKVEVIYNPASGIDTVNASTVNSLSLSGRTLGIANGSFSVYSLDGTMLASDAQSFQFQQGGTYIVMSNSGKTIKVNVR